VSSYHHRRQCEKWNRKNKAYFKNNYLADKIAEIDQQEQSKDPPGHKPERPKKPSIFFLPQSHQTEPILPMDVIVAQYGKRPAVIIQYLVFQVIRHFRVRTSGFP